MFKPFRLLIVLCISSFFITSCSGNNDVNPYVANEAQQNILNNNNAYDVIKGVIELLNEEPMTSTIAIQQNAFRDQEQLARTTNFYGGSTSRVSVNEIRQWEDLNLTKVSGQQHLQVNEFNLSKFARAEFGGSGGAGLTASFTVSDLWSNNNPVSVTASLNYLSEQDTGFEWQSGSIQILATDGSLIIVEPASNSWVVSIDEQVIDVIPATGKFWVNCGSNTVCPELY